MLLWVKVVSRPVHARVLGPGKPDTGREDGCQQICRSGLPILMQGSFRQVKPRSPGEGGDEDVKNISAVASAVRTRLIGNKYV